MELLPVEFARPWAFVLLLAVPYLIGVAALETKRTARLVLPTAALLAAGGRGFFAHLSWLPHALRIGAVALCAVALARPQSRAPITRDLSVEGIDIVIALDLSTSMNAVDFRPQDRAVVAKEVLAGFIDRRPNDRLGLVIFAGDAYTQCPLTLDHRVLKDIVRELRTGVIADGTAIGNSLGTAINRLRESQAKSKVVILITDGDNNAGNISPREAAEIAAGMGIRIFTIMVGKICDRPDGCPVPFPAGTDMFGRPAYKNVVIPVNPELLRDIARTTGGEFYVATDRESLEGNLEDVLKKLEKSRVYESSQTANVVDAYDRWLLPAFLLAAFQVLLGATLLRRFP